MLKMLAGASAMLAITHASVLAQAPPQRQAPRQEFKETTKRFVDYLNEGYEVKMGSLVVAPGSQNALFITMLQKGKSVALCTLRTEKVGTTSTCDQTAN